MPWLRSAAVAGGFALAATAAHAQPLYGSSSYPQTRDIPPPNAADRGYSYEDAPAPPSASVGAQGYGAMGDPQAPPDLARELSLRADQRAALQAYQQAISPNSDEEGRAETDQHAMAGMTTPQRLDTIAAQMRREDAEFGRHADAVRRFYYQLTPTQQRRFDQLSAPAAASDEGADPANGEENAAGRTPPR